MRPEDLVIERSLALHAEVVERLRRDPHLFERARIRVNGWAADGSVHEDYARAWVAILALPPEAAFRQILERTEAAHDLRQVSPFAGILDARTRWSILKSVEEHGRRHEAP